MNHKTKYPPKLDQEIKVFFEYACSERLSRNLRRLLTSYLLIQQDAHLMDIEDLLIDMQYLFELLDTATDELHSNTPLGIN